VGEWCNADGNFERYMVAWGRAACNATSKNAGKAISQLSLPYLDADATNDELEMWADARLDQMFRAYKITNDGLNMVGAGLMHPVFNYAPPPSPVLDAIYLAFTRVVKAQKRATETVVPSGNKYTDRQLVQLMAFCGLKPGRKSELLEIWTTLQSTKNWSDAGIELIKWFQKGTGEDQLPYQFHKELIEGIKNLCILQGPAPLVNNAHMGISILAFSLITMLEEAHMRKDQEARDGATNITAASYKSAKRMYPSIPTIYGKFE